MVVRAIAASGSEPVRATQRETLTRPEGSAWTSRQAASAGRSGVVTAKRLTSLAGKARESCQVVTTPGRTAVTGGAGSSAGTLSA